MTNNYLSNEEFNFLLIKFNVSLAEFNKELTDIKFLLDDINKNFKVLTEKLKEEDKYIATYLGQINQIPNK